MLLKRILFIHTIKSKIKNNSDKIASTITYTIILELKTTLTRAIKVTIYNKHGNMDEKKKKKNRNNNNTNNNGNSLVIKNNHKYENVDINDYQNPNNKQ